MNAAPNPSNIRPPEELWRIFLDHRKALISSNSAYDRGDLWEATRLSTCIYSLLHDGGKNSKSILGQLDLKNGIHFLSSSGGFRLEHIYPDNPYENDGSPPAPLCTIQVAPEQVS